MEGRSRAIGVVKWFNAAKGYGFLAQCERVEDTATVVAAIAARERVMTPPNARSLPQDDDRMRGFAMGPPSVRAGGRGMGTADREPLSGRAQVPGSVMRRGSRASARAGAGRTPSSVATSRTVRPDAWAFLAMAAAPS